MWQAYTTPTTVEQALDVLARHEGRARLIAGGTDLVLELQRGGHDVECLVDVTRIPGLDRIRQDGEWIVLGPNVTFRQILESPLVREQAPVLAEAAATVGALQIQTMATLAGNVANAMPAADGSVALLALDAEAQIADEQGRAWRPVDGLFVGPGRSAIDSTRQMITGFRFRAAGPGVGSAWERIGRRRALVLPILNCGVCLVLGDGRRIAWARIALGPVARVPFRARQAEAFLREREAEPAAYAEAGEIAAAECQPRSSVLRASKEYRVAVLKVMVRQALATAEERAVARSRV